MVITLKTTEKISDNLVACSPVSPKVFHVPNRECRTRVLVVLISVVGIVPQHSRYVVAVAIRKFGKGRKPSHQKFYQLGGEDGGKTGGHTSILGARTGMNAGQPTRTTDTPPRTREY